jgi:hypothetical protein
MPVSLTSCVPSLCVCVCVCVCGWVGGWVCGWVGVGGWCGASCVPPVCVCGGGGAWLLYLLSRCILFSLFGHKKKNVFTAVYDCLSWHSHELSSANACRLRVCVCVLYVPYVCVCVCVCVFVCVCHRLLLLKLALSSTSVCVSCVCIPCVCVVCCVCVRLPHAHTCLRWDSQAQMHKSVFLVCVLRVSVCCVLFVSCVYSIYHSLRLLKLGLSSTPPPRHGALRL